MSRLYLSPQPPQRHKMHDSLRNAMTAPKPIVVTAGTATAHETKIVDAGTAAGTDVVTPMEMKT